MGLKSIRPEKTGLLMRSTQLRSGFIGYTTDIAKRFDSVRINGWRKQNCHPAS
ncbi:hypothetical protein [Nitrosomonas sp. Nm51]|uniref:hypothetical protein n=1 Tax=Nitrosomonas sp. Nm51 TaxID=133720 RepID=UPI001C434194|nr:hypothetical protein [Nitrosomonas sp. Nm51]